MDKFVDPDAVDVGGQDLRLSDASSPPWPGAGGTPEEDKSRAESCKIFSNIFLSANSLGKPPFLPGDPLRFPSASSPLPLRFANCPSSGPGLVIFLADYQRIKAVEAGE